ncbi:MAG: hypothetical protein AB7G75_32245 [Candidatus Binatia bacterium]
MPIRVRVADLNVDRAILIDALARFLTPESTPRRYDWLYLGSPHGRPRSWLAIDDNTSEIIGVASAFPRRLYFEGRELTGWILGDFCISDHYRSLGPALQLQRACLAEIAGDKATFCYDLPSPGMMAVYRRLHIGEYGCVTRLTKPLTVDRKVRETVRVPFVADIVSPVANVFLKLRDKSCRHGNKVATITALPVGRDIDDDEFSVLAREIGDRYGACIQRSTEYINWRYMQHPVVQHEMFTARVHDRLVAYAVFAQTHNDATLVDLFGHLDESVLRGLLGSICDELRDRRVATLSAPIWETHPCRQFLLGIGFIPREDNPVVFYPHNFSGVEPRKKFSWFLMQGDRDS